VQSAAGFTSLLVTSGAVHGEALAEPSLSAAYAMMASWWRTWYVAQAPPCLGVEAINDDLRAVKSTRQRSLINEVVVAAAAHCITRAAAAAAAGRYTAAAATIAQPVLVGL
jgi:hypothetical protein